MVAYTVHVSLEPPAPALFSCKQIAIFVRLYHVDPAAMPAGQKCEMLKDVSTSWSKGGRDIYGYW